MPSAVTAPGKEIITCIKTICAEANGKPWEFFFKPLHQPVARFSFTVLFFCFFSIRIFHKFRHDAYNDIRMEDNFCFQHVIIIFRVFPVSTFVMDSEKAFFIQFLPAAVELCPVHDHLPVFIPDPGVFKGTAAQQPADQFKNSVLQLLRIQFFQIFINGFPVRQFICSRFFRT